MPFAWASCLGCLGWFTLDATAGISETDGFKHLRRLPLGNSDFLALVRSGTLTFSMQLSMGMRLYCWKMKPMFAARKRVTACLSILCNGQSKISTSPRSAAKVPAMTLRRVVL